MNDAVLPDARTVEDVLGAVDGPWGPGTRVVGVRDLSPGLGGSAVLGVRAEAADGRPSRWIVKIPAWGRRSLLEPRDAQLDRREARFFRSGLPARLPRGLAAPSDAVVTAHRGLDWIVMHDLGSVLRRAWTPAAAAAAAERIALLHAAGAARPGLLDAPWLERDGFAAYAHHVPAGHANLDALPHEPLLQDLLDRRQILALHRCLDAADLLRARAAALPRTLVHGDFTPRNAGLGPDGVLTLIDWEHVGVGPVGYDLGTFVALYRAFDGRGTLDEAALLAAYGRALGVRAGPDPGRAAALGFATAQLTWGLHLRLGPGLTAVRQGALGETPQALAPHLADIRDGCLRALGRAAEAGVPAAAG